jgi:hypothetical protein
MFEPLDVSSSESITEAQRDALIARLQTAWKNLPPEKQAAIKPILDESHKQLAAYLDGGPIPAHDTQTTLRMKSYLTGDWDGHLQTLDESINQAVAQPLAEPVVAKALEISVSPSGEIVGSGKYQKLDLRWELVAGTVWLENLLHKHPFPKGSPNILRINNNVSIVMAADFGTGNFGSGDSPSTKISKFIPSLNPDYTIHLGDVYYAGTSPEEANNFINFWPRGSKGSFTLNSNHEMYSGGDPYFNQVVGGPVFNKLQSPYSFFALENDDWIIAGMDSAYYSDVVTLYLNGTLGAANAQIDFLKAIASAGKKVILLTHHNGIPENGEPPDAPGNSALLLFTDVMSAFAGQYPPAYWYYGHAHVGAAYTPLTGYKGMLCRCIGHGALPWGYATDLKAGKDNNWIEWFETRNANDPDDRLRIFNGFVSIQLTGPDLTETFYDENGQIAFQKP